MTTLQKRKRRPSFVFTDTKLFRTACLMPGGLQHWPRSGQPFDIAKSEVVAWLIIQPEIQDWLFEKLKSVPGDCFRCCDFEPGAVIRRRFAIARGSRPTWRRRGFSFRRLQAQQR